MPTAFVENFGLKARTALDCSEISIDQPRLMQPCAETWPQYKHHKTVKFLVAIRP